MPIFEQGLDILLKYSDLPQQIETLLQIKCNTEFDCVRLKAAIWAIAHVSTSAQGLKYLLMKRVFERIIYTAKYCDVYSIRATALHALGLIGSTKEGSNLLQKFGKHCAEVASLMNILQVSVYLSLIQIGFAFDTIGTHCGRFVSQKNGCSKISHQFDIKSMKCLRITILASMRISMVTFKRPTRHRPG